MVTVRQVSVSGVTGHESGDSLSRFLSNAPFEVPLLCLCPRSVFGINPSVLHNLMEEEHNKTPSTDQDHIHYHQHLHYHHHHYCHDDDSESVDVRKWYLPAFYLDDQESGS